jgi:Flp pilus assembly protein TadG
MVAHATPGQPHRARQEGQVLYLFAGAFVVLMLVAGLVVDAGFAFFQRRDAQNVADLAAVAGTQEVAQHYVAATYTSQDVWNAINASTVSNNCTGTAPNTCTWSASYVNRSQQVLSSVTDDTSAIPGGAMGVQVNIHWPANTIIVGPVLSVMGLQPVSVWDVRTTATALAASAKQQAPAGQLLPIAMDGRTNWTPNQPLTITDAQLDNPGAFGWLTWNGIQSAGTVDTSVCTPNNTAFTLPSWIQSSTGVKQQGGNSSGPGTTLGCLNYYMTNQIPVLIPVYDGVSNGSSTSCTPASQNANGSNTQYCITGVVAMYIDSVNWGPGIKSITGTFLSTYAPPGVITAGLGSTPPAQGDKFYYIGLVR